MDPETTTAVFGALVVSFDFELHWGVRSDYGREYEANLLGGRAAIPEILDLFDKFNIAATWAAVGFLFAEDRDELLAFSPEIRPAYLNPAFDPYRQAVGKNERDDPLHFGHSLIRQIAAAPRQEIGTHTFSHYYCLAEGQNEKEFAADLRSAVAIAASKGLRLRSLVFPRNQVNRQYLGIVRAAGIEAYRGGQAGWMHQPAAGPASHLLCKLGRAADGYLDVSGCSLSAWGMLLEQNGLCNVAASRFLQPYRAPLRAFEPLRLARITSAIEQAARTNRICHLWSHPHNFGIHRAENLHNLRLILEEFSRCREMYGMRSLTMSAAASCALMGETARMEALC